MMKNNFILTKNLRYFIIFIVFISFSVMADTIIYTPKNTAVTVFYNGPDMDQADKDAFRDWVNTHYPHAIILDEASQLYNCHSYAWNISEGGPIYWMNTPEDDKYWNDGSYIEVSNAFRGEKVSYLYDDHSAIETSVDDTFDSKWADMPLCRHSRTHCPFDGMGNWRVKYYARYVRTIQNKTFGNDEDVKYASYGSFTTGNTTIEDGAVVRFVSHGGIVIQPGFEVESGGKLTIETW